MRDRSMLRQAIAAALARFRAPGVSLTEAAAHFFATLGYACPLAGDLLRDAACFREAFGQTCSFTPTESQALDGTRALHLVLQFTADELALRHQPELMERLPGIDQTRIESYLLFAADLPPGPHPRVRLATLVRAINKPLAMPAMLLCRHGDTLSFGIIHRRLHRLDAARDVLAKVTFIKDIRLANPHRAHLEILADLAVDELRRRHPPCDTFPQLHDAWRKTLDIQALNKRFYQELANWYFWALGQVSFPPDAPKDTDGRHSVSVIRLITRLIFCWFLREKGLIPDSLFTERQVRQWLHDLSPQATSYYKAILQNLFFATLNQEMGLEHDGKPKRRFRLKGYSGKQFMVTNLYRYEELMRQPTAVLAEFAGIPFLNGGLFECLDRDLGTGEARQRLRIDGFSDRPDNPLSVPNDLFFGAERQVDLSETYGDPRYQKAKVRGLLEIFSSYKFTIAENTPNDEEVALDPELLGRVFENLLAAFNPETRVTARKQTGSFYTPREIVAYMVDEALKAYLRQAALPLGTAPDQWRTRIDAIFSPGETDCKLAPAEATALVKAIGRVKILDPACGSGAFPMGILHRLVDLLQKADPNNASWKRDRLAEAERYLQLLRDSQAQPAEILACEERIADISRSFDTHLHALDFARKLHLITNCIYGVDIQPIAVEISKLRCFISLVVEQEPHPGADNLGIRALPNLETRFVAANSLIGLNAGGPPLRSPAVQALEAQLRAVRERHFNARSTSAKRLCREDDARLREQLRATLIAEGWPSEIASRIAAWDPYETNHPSPFFDHEWMFGLSEGFDIVIGNPPYVVSKDEALRQIYSDSIFGRPNLYGFFIHAALKEYLRAGGYLMYINPRTILTDSYCSKLRAYIQSHGSMFLVLNIVDRRNLFESVLQSCVVNMIYNGQYNGSTVVKSIASKEDITNKTELLIAKDDFLFGPPQSPLYLVGESPLTYSIFAKMRRLKPMQYYGNKFTTGKIQWDLYSAFLSSTSAPECARLIWAENIKRFSMVDARLRKDKLFLLKPPENIVPIRDETIVVQRTTAVEQPWRIFACLVSSHDYGYPIFCENNTSYLVTCNKKWPLVISLGILSSRLLDFIFRHVNSNTHVSGGELNALPWPDMASLPAVLANTIAEVTGKLILAAKNNTQTLELQQALDLAVCQAYGLSAEEIAHVLRVAPAMEE